MEKLKPRTLSGFMELLPAPQQKFERMLDILRKTFSLYGFTTPEERNTFEMILGVSGVGAKTAASLLSNISTSVISST